MAHDPDRLPTREELLEFVLDAEKPVGVRELARAFRVKGAERTELRRMLRELEAEGALDRGRGKRVAPPGALPEVAVVQVTGTAEDGGFVAVPTVWPHEGPPPQILMEEARGRAGRLARGAKVLARLARIGGGRYRGTPIRVLTEAPKRALGLVERAADRSVIQSIERGSRDTFEIGEGEAAPGDAVLIETLPGRRRGRGVARIVERIGRADDPSIFSALSLHAHEIPVEFPAAAIEQAAAARPVGLDGREDLRAIPLVTIDGEDARDFDDAVYAEPDPDAPGGWRLLVAIADVAWYVREDDALDREALNRGNSVYFPDRVVPMLPEALSNNLCSLRPREDRACLAVRLHVDADGNLTGHRFVRGLMRSAARLTYRRVQDAIDGRPDDETGPLLGPVIEPLYGAFRALDKARRRRGALELDLPERQVLLDDAGRIRAIVPRLRLDSHRLIEEFMIAANVAAAETLERANLVGMYRVHEKPDPAKAQALREFLLDFGVKIAPGQLERPKHFNDLLRRVAGDPLAALVHEMVLRTQAQADYRPENRGHFGLALDRYAHFTSPIRRYADLVVHRALITAAKLGTGGLRTIDLARFVEIGEHISMTERRAAAAEREVVDRFTAAHLASQVGEVLEGTITGVARFGLFVRLADTGADGFCPVATLPSDWYDHDAGRHLLQGRQNGLTWALGDRVRVRLVSASPLAGSLLVEALEVTESHRPAPDRVARAPARRGVRRGTPGRPKEKGRRR